MNSNPTMVFLNRSFDKKRLKALLLWFRLNLSEGAALRAVEILQGLGFRSATQGAISLGLDDLKTPASKSGRVFQAQVEVSLAHYEHHRGNRTPVELFQHLVDTWHRTSQDLTTEVVKLFHSTERVNPVYMMAFSGARGNISQVRQLVGMRGLMADPRGQIVGFPILSNFREGLTITEYFVSCYGARKGVVDTAIRTADAGYLTRRLADVSHHVVVRTTNCGTHRSIRLRDIKEGQKTVLSLANRLVGRVLAECTSKPSGEFAQRNEEITPDLASKLASQHLEVPVRSPLTCSLRWGVCQLCYGWGLSEGRRVTLGEAVGIIAAQSIGEPGTQLTLRTFHTGGVFSGDLLNEIRAPYTGTINFSRPLQGLLVRTPHGQIAFLTKVTGKMTVSPTSEMGNSDDDRQANNESSCQLVESSLDSNRSLLETDSTFSVNSSDSLSNYSLLPHNKGRALVSYPWGYSKGTTLWGKTLSKPKSYTNAVDECTPRGKEKDQDSKNHTIRSPFVFSDPEKVPIGRNIKKQKQAKGSNDLLPLGVTGIHKVVEFVLQPSTVIFVRQKEQVYANQLLAEFSSSNLQSTNDQIEVTQQVLSEAAGQVWFKGIYYGNRKGPGSGSLGTHFSSQKLGGIWVLAGKPTSELVLTDRRPFPLPNFSPSKTSRNDRQLMCNPEKVNSDIHVAFSTNVPTFLATDVGDLRQVGKTERSPNLTFSASKALRDRKKSNTQLFLNSWIPYLHQLIKPIVLFSLPQESIFGCYKNFFTENCLQRNYFQQNRLESYKTSIINLQHDYNSLKYHYSLGYSQLIRCTDFRVNFSFRGNSNVERNGSLAQKEQNNSMSYPFGFHTSKATGYQIFLKKQIVDAFTQPLKVGFAKLSQLDSYFDYDDLLAPEKVTSCWGQPIESNCSDQLLNLALGDLLKRQQNSCETNAIDKAHLLLGTQIMKKVAFSYPSGVRHTSKKGDKNYTHNPMVAHGDFKVPHSLLFQDKRVKATTKSFVPHLRESWLKESKFGESRSEKTNGPRRGKIKSDQKNMGSVAWWLPKEWKTTAGVLLENSFFANKEKPEGLLFCLLTSSFRKQKFLFRHDPEISSTFYISWNSVSETFEIKIENRTRILDPLSFRFRRIVDSFRSPSTETEGVRQKVQANKAVDIFNELKNLQFFNSSTKSKTFLSYPFGFDFVDNMSKTQNTVLSRDYNRLPIVSEANHAVDSVFKGFRKSEQICKVLESYLQYGGVFNEFTLSYFDYDSPNKVRKNIKLLEKEWVKSNVAEINLQVYNPVLEKLFYNDTISPKRFQVFPYNSFDTPKGYIGNPAFKKGLVLDLPSGYATDWHIVKKYQTLSDPTLRGVGVLKSKEKLKTNFLALTLNQQNKTGIVINYPLTLLFTKYKSQNTPVIAKLMRALDLNLRKYSAANRKIFSSLQQNHTFESFITLMYKKLYLSDPSFSTFSVDSFRFSSYPKGVEETEVVRKPMTWHLHKPLRGKFRSYYSNGCSLSYPEGIPSFLPRRVVHLSEKTNGPRRGKNCFAGVRLTLPQRTKGYKNASPERINKIKAIDTNSEKITSLKRKEKIKKLLMINPFWQALSLTSYPNKIQSIPSAPNPLPLKKYNKVFLPQRDITENNSYPVHLREKTKSNKRVCKMMEGSKNKLKTRLNTAVNNAIDFVYKFPQHEKKKGENRFVSVHKPVWLSVHICNDANAVNKVVDLSPFSSKIFSINENWQMRGLLKSNKKKQRIERNDGSLNQHIVHTIHLPIVPFLYIIQLSYESFQHAIATLRSASYPFPYRLYVTPFGVYCMPLSTLTKSTSFLYPEGVRPTSKECTPRVVHLSEKTNGPRRGKNCFAEDTSWDCNRRLLEKKVLNVKTCYQSHCGVPVQGNLLALIRQNLWVEGCSNISERIFKTTAGVSALTKNNLLHKRFFDNLFLSSNPLITEAAIPEENKKIRGLNNIVVLTPEGYPSEKTKSKKNTTKTKATYQKKNSLSKTSNPTSQSEPKDSAYFQNSLKENVLAWSSSNQTRTDLRISSLDFRTLLPIRTIINPESRYTFAHLKLPSNNLVTFISTSVKPKAVVDQSQKTKSKALKNSSFVCKKVKLNKIYRTFWTELTKTERHIFSLMCSVSYSMFSTSCILGDNGLGVCMNCIPEAFLSIDSKTLVIFQTPFALYPLKTKWSNKVSLTNHQFSIKAVPNPKVQDSVGVHGKIEADKLKKFCLVNEIDMEASRSLRPIGVKESNMSDFLEKSHLQGKNGLILWIWNKKQTKPGNQKLENGFSLLRTFHKDIRDSRCLIEFSKNFVINSTNFVNNTCFLTSSFLSEAAPGGRASEQPEGVNPLYKSFFSKTKFQSITRYQPTFPCYALVNSFRSPSYPKGYRRMDPEGVRTASLEKSVKVRKSFNNKTFEKTFGSLQETPHTNCFCLMQRILEYSLERSNLTQWVTDKRKKLKYSPFVVDLPSTLVGEKLSTFSPFPTKEPNHLENSLGQKNLLPLANTILAGNKQFTYLSHPIYLYWHVCHIAFDIISVNRPNQASNFIGSKESKVKANQQNVSLVHESHDIFTEKIKHFGLYYYLVRFASFEEPIVRLFKILQTSYHFISFSREINSNKFQKGELIFSYQNSQMNVCYPEGLSTKSKSSEQDKVDLKAFHKFSKNTTTLPKPILSESDQVTFVACPPGGESKVMLLQDHDDLKFQTVWQSSLNKRSKSINFVNKPVSFVDQTKSIDLFIPLRGKTESKNKLGSFFQDTTTLPTQVPPFGSAEEIYSQGDMQSKRQEMHVKNIFHLFPGQLVAYGDNIAKNMATTESGQVLYVDSQKTTLRKAQTVLIYSQAIIAVSSGEWIRKGTPLMALSYQKLVTGDIVQGLPKIEQFFEAPLLKDGTFWRDSLQAKLNQFFQEHREKLPLAEAVRKGFSEIQRVLVEGVQQVYISQGVLIADKHLEVIVRQMTCKGRILYSGDTGFLRNELVSLDKIESVNQVTYGQKALYHPQVRGITDASLESESFLSAASFQETTRVLSRDAIIGKTDLMRGLKERVIVGELIQAGTGLANNNVYNLL